MPSSPEDTILLRSALRFTWIFFVLLSHLVDCISKFHILFTSTISGWLNVVFFNRGKLQKSVKFKNYYFFLKYMWVSGSNICKIKHQNPKSSIRHALTPTLYSVSLPLLLKQCL